MIHSQIFNIYTYQVMRTKFFNWLIIFLWGKSSIVDSNMWIPTSCSDEIIIHWVGIHSIYWNRFSGTNRICSVSSPRYGSWIFLDKQFGRLRLSNIHVVKNSIFSTGYECMRALKYKYFENKNVARGLKINNVCIMWDIPPCLFNLGIIHLW